MSNTDLKINKFEIIPKKKKKLKLKDIFIPKEKKKVIKRNNKRKLKTA